MSDLDEVAMGGMERQELEKQVEALEEKVEDCARTQKDMFLVICQRMITVLTEHLSSCDQEGVDYETTWFLSSLDNFRQLLVQVCVCARGTAVDTDGVYVSLAELRASFQAFFQFGVFGLYF